MKHVEDVCSNRSGLAGKLLSGFRHVRALRVPFVALAGLVLAAPVHAQSCAVGETPVAFGFTGGEQTVTVPAGVTSATVYLSGAQGGAGRSGAGTIGGSPNSPGGTGGLGGRVRGTLAVTPGATLSVWVGGQASQAVNAGGIGQGVDGIGGGGTDIRVGGNAIGNRVAIAGGGGGGGNAGWSTSNVIAGGNGGVGGGGVGTKGTDVPGGPGPYGGGGGAVGTGGAGGGGCGSFPATGGNAANGDGGDSFNFSGSFSGAGFGGGGGGGATVGAGGGGAGVGTTACQQNWNGGGGGGGGGSSAASGLTAVAFNNGVQAGNGAALICFAPSRFSVGGPASGQTGPVTLQITATNPVSTEQVVVAQAATTYVFPTTLPQGANWSVSVVSAPAGQLCSVSPASGTAIASNVTNATLTCATVAVTVNPATLPDGAFGAAYSQTLSATSANGGVGPYNFSLTAGALPSGLALSTAGALSGTPTAAGSFNFTVQATSSNGFSGNRAYTLVIAPGTQAITGFTSTPAAPVFAPGGTFDLSASGGASGNPVVFGSSTPAVCTVSGNTVTMQAAGHCALTADQAGNANYQPAPQATLAVTIGAAVQSITGFVALPAAPVYAPNGTFSVTATGGASGNPVVFGSSTPLVCTVSGSTVTLLAAGNCGLTADQAGDSNYQPAPQATLAVNIAQASQSITGFDANPASPVYASNGTFSVSAIGGASGNPVAFGSTSPAVCTVSGSTVTMHAAGHCALTADQAGDANYAAAPQATLAVTIGLASQSITGFVANPATPVFASNGTFTVSATGGASGNPVLFGSTSLAVCTVSGSTVTMHAAGTCSLVANQVGNGNYAAAPQASLYVNIGLASQVIGNFVATPANPVYAPGATFTVSADGGASGNPVVFTSASPSLCAINGTTVTMAGAGACQILANQAGDANYTAAPEASFQVSIQQAPQAITNFVANPASPVFAPGGTFTVSATPGASLNAVVFGSNSPAVCTVAGSTVTMLTAGSCSLTADQAGDANHAAAPQASLVVAIGTAAQAITNFAANPGAPAYAPNGTFTVSANGGASGNPVVFGSTSPAVCTVAGATVTMHAAGNCALIANQAGNGSYGAAPQASLAVTVAPAVQAITGFTANPAAPAFASQGTFTLSATGGASGSPVVFDSTSPAVCTVAGSTVTMLAAGDCALTADQAGNGNYSAAPQVSLSVAIAPGVQAITGFTADPGAPVFVPNGSFSLSAVGGASGSPVVFGSTTPAVCTVAGSTVTMHAAGNCALTADQAGNGNYDAAPQLSLSVAIAPGVQSITGFSANPAAPVYAPNGTFTLSATAGASTSPVVFGSTTPAVCTVSGNTVTMLAAGGCSLFADQAGDANYGAAPRATLVVAIGTATQAITGFAANPATPVFAPGGTFAVSATGGASSSPVVFASTTPAICTVVGSTVTMLGAGMCSLTADQAADGNYSAAPQVALDVVIDAATQAITDFVANPAQPVYATNGTFTVSATAGASSSPVVYGSTTPAVCSVSGSSVTMLAAGTCALTADQAGDANYAAAPQATLDVVIGAATPVLDWVPSIQKVTGAPAFDLADPTSTSPGSFAFTSSDAQVATVSGRTVTIVGAGTVTLTATQAATGNYTTASITTTLTVTARPDPTRDPGVVAGLQAQVDTSVRFAITQQDNIRDRLRQLRQDTGRTPSVNGMTLNVSGGERGGSLAVPMAGASSQGQMERAAPHGWGLWTAGTITLGERDRSGTSHGFDLRSDGLTIGVDRRFGDNGVLGFAAGAGWSDADYDQDRSGLDAEQRALSVYGQWRDADGPFFIDGTLGWGNLDFDLARWSDLADATAHAQRDGDQQYASLNMGYEHRAESGTFAGYGRLDGSRTRLDAYRETGLGLYDLDYRAQTIESSTVAVGVEGSRVFAWRSAGLRPFWSFEYRDALTNNGEIGINYVVQPEARDYLLRLRSYNEDVWALGAGIDIDFHSGWQLSFQYRREEADALTSDSFGFRLSWQQRVQAPVESAAQTGE